MLEEMLTGLYSSGVAKAHFKLSCLHFVEQVGACSEQEIQRPQEVRHSARVQQVDGGAVQRDDYAVQE